MNSSRNLPLLLALAFCIATFVSVGVFGRGFKTLGSFPTSMEGVSVQQLAFYISDYQLDQNGALLECQAIFLGRMVTILLPEQDDYIRTRLQILGYGREQVHTAGRYNADNSTWEWTTTLRPINYTNWRPSEPSTTTDSCVDLLGESSSYGWVSRACINPHFFICEVAF